MRTANAPVRSTSGFTLLEVLVVVVILAVLVSLVTVRIAPDARQSLREEATRLAAVLGHAHDEALVTGAAFAWQPDANGYRSCGATRTACGAQWTAMPRCARARS